MSDDQHILILPYFCDEEIDRYLKIAQRLKTFPQPQCRVHFLLANSPRTKPSRQLHRAYSELGPCTSFSCPTQIFGYPQGPTAMYWDAMEFVSEKFGRLDGFCLWLESDMAPVKANWLDRLSAEWFSDRRPLMMGCYVPDIYKRRFFRRPKLILNAHVNGGACYATDFAKRIPVAARKGVFDMEVFQYAIRQDGVRPTRQIAFSTLARVRRDVVCPDKVLLHGYLQDKDSFIDACLRPVSAGERRASIWHPLQDQMEMLQRRIRVNFVRRGHRAMLENVLLTKQQVEAARKPA